MAQQLRVGLLGPDLGLPHGHPQQHRRVAVGPRLPGAGGGIHQGLLGLDPGHQLHDDLLVQVLDAALAVGALGLVIDDAHPPADPGDQIQGPGVADGPVPHGDLRGQRLRAVGLPPFVEPVRPGGLLVQHQRLSGALDVVLPAHGPQGDGLAVGVHAIPARGGLVPVALGGQGGVADDGVAQPRRSSGARGPVVLQDGLGGHVPVPASQVRGLLADDRGDRGDLGLAAVRAGVHATVLGLRGEPGLGHGRGAPGQGTEGSPPDGAARTGRDAGQRERKRPPPESVPAGAFAAPAGSLFVRDAGFEPATSSV